MAEAFGKLASEMWATPKGYLVPWDFKQQVRSCSVSSDTDGAGMCFTPGRVRLIGRLASQRGFCVRKVLGYCGIEPGGCFSASPHAFRCHVRCLMVGMLRREGSRMTQGSFASRIGITRFF